MGIDRSEGGTGSYSNQLSSMNWLDAALGYYDILGRQEPSKPPTLDLADDEYSQV